MLHAAWNLLARKLRLLLSAFAIVLGVAFVRLADLHRHPQQELRQDRQQQRQRRVVRSRPGWRATSPSRPRYQIPAFAGRDIAPASTA